ncbi:MAG: pantoate--beta-alanine ligase [Pseudomonadota bacterium]
MAKLAPEPVMLATPTAVRAQVAAWRTAGERIALVPTMGALHAGHLALVEAAKAQADRVLVSIFVNPTQFAPHEDFDQYPRHLDRDLQALSTLGVDGIYTPTRALMYPQGHQTTVSVSGVAHPMEGEYRPHFFSGVATIVAKLFIQCAPDLAVFGEKDYQQLLVIRQMARDLDLPVTVVGHPTVREADGLALSSRNAYLSVDQRAVAAHLPQTLHHIAAGLAAGKAFADFEKEAKERLRAVGFEPPDYLDFRDAETLEPLDRATWPGRLLVAAKLGQTRLIDNLAVPVVVP